MGGNGGVLGCSIYTKYEGSGVALDISGLGDGYESCICTRTIR
jgi:hypothetical protein